MQYSVCLCFIISVLSTPVLKAPTQRQDAPDHRAQPIPIQVRVESPANPFSSVRDGATIISLLLGGLSLFLVLRGHRISRAGLDAKAAWDTLNLLEGKDGENRKRWYLLEKLILDAEGRGQVFDVLNASSANRNELHELARAYDMAGHLVKHHLISDEFLFDFYSRPLAVTWKYLEPYIEQRRRNPSLPQPGHMLQFQILATGAALYRKEGRPEETLFEIKPEIEILWRAWKKRSWRRRNSSMSLT